MSKENEVLTKIEKLLLGGVIENQKAIITTMIIGNTYVPQVLAREMTRIGGPRRKVFKAVCDLTGYSLDDFSLSQAHKNRVKEKYPDLCKGCAIRHKEWELQFQNTKKEIESYRRQAASF